MRGPASTLAGRVVHDSEWQVGLVRRAPLSSPWRRKSNAAVVEPPQWSWSKFGSAKETWQKLAATIGW